MTLVLHPVCPDVRLSTAYLTLMTVFALGCSIVEPDTFAEPALIVFYGDSAKIVVPDTVARGVAFPVTYKTFGGGCTRQGARDELTLSATVVEIRPYDLTHRGDNCTSDALDIPHSTSVTLDQPGVAAIRLVGVQRPTAGMSVNSPAQLQRTV